MRSVAKRLKLFWTLRSSALLLAIAAGSWMLSTTLVQAAPPVSACEQCHGRGGDSFNDLIPRINGQQPLYILRRLREMTQTGFDSPPRPFAMQQAAHEPESVNTDIAHYFASRSPTLPAKGPASGLGAQIYHQGIPSRHVAACAYCHGPEGEGSGLVPRIGGQHKAYLNMWLGMRTANSLPGSGAMHLAIGKLTPAEIDAVTSYLAGD